MADRLYVSTTKPDALATAISGTDTAIPLIDGSTFPDPALAGLPYTVIVAYGTDREEVMLATAKPTPSTLTVTRGQDSTAATPKNIGDIVVHGVSAQDFNLIKDKVDRAGDTMTGPLVLHGDPTADLHAVPRQYLTSNVSGKVDRSGDTMTGRLHLMGIPITDPEAANKQYVDTETAKRVADTGDTMTGPLVLPGDPTLPLQAAPKQYVDTKAADRVLRAGDVMTGPLGFQVGTSAGHGIHAASLRSTASIGTDVGYLLITIPAPTALSTMFQFVVSGYDYAVGAGQWRLDIGGYAAQVTGWARTSARAEGLFPGADHQLPVKFLSRGTSGAMDYAIAIGAVDTAWSYPQAVLEVIGGYTGYALASTPGYGMTITTSLTGWTTNATVTPSTPYKANAGEIRLLAMTTQTIPSGGSFTKITGFLVQSGDTGNGDLAYSSGNLTSATGGYYDVSVATYWNTADSDAKVGYRAAEIMVSGVRVIRVDTVPSSTGAQYNQIGMNAIYVPAGGVLSTNVYQNSGGTLSLDGARWHVRKVASLT